MAAPAKNDRPGPCLDDNQLAALADGDLSREQRAAALAHTEGCATCESLVSNAVQVSRPPLGRYRLVGEIGVGGMGRIYRAFDPKLEREVAVKVVRSERIDATSGARRLLREARALAKLSHPNVASVFDVEEAGDEVFIAMEFVDGCTLRSWLGGQRRPREIAAAFISAGRGLQAAHAAGLVHRDFKASNVMVADDGRVVVLDFGLAFGSVTLPVEGTILEAPQPAASVSIGAAAGTPLYMAPEQYDGTADARSDQYAFCVAMVEAFAGEFPFESTATPTLFRDKRECRVTANALARVPREYRAALLRGMRGLPGDRWPDMDALLHALSPGRRLRYAAIAGGIALFSATALAITSTGGDGRETFAHPAVVDPGVCDPPEFIVLLDRSASMKEPFAGDETLARIEAVGEAVAETADRYGQRIRLGITLLPHDKGDSVCGVVEDPCWTRVPDVDGPVCGKPDWDRLCEEPGAEILIPPGLDGVSDLRENDLARLPLCFGGAPSLALRVVRQQLAGARTERREQVVIVATDTPDNCGSTLTAVRELAADGVVVYTVAIDGARDGKNPKLWRSDLNYLACAGRVVAEGACARDSSGATVPRDPFGEAVFIDGRSADGLQEGLSRVFERHACAE